MATQALARTGMRIPALFNDFFTPFNDLFDGGSIWNREMTVPAVNIIEQKDDYQISLAAPGLKKDDFNIDVAGNIITISCEKEEKKEDKNGRYNRKEYSYSSFERSFTLPDEVNMEKIDAKYEDGILKLVLPKKEEAKKIIMSKHIAVK